MPIGFSSDALFSKVGVPRVDIGISSIGSPKDGVTRYVYGTGLVASVKNGDISYYHSDRIGSNRLIIDSSGSVEEEFKSLPFGQEIKNNGVRYSFATGKELDESNLYYFGARYYDFNVGRFTSVDPIASGHAYVYSSNNPLYYVDLDGLSDTSVEIIFSEGRSGWDLILSEEKFSTVLEKVGKSVETYSPLPSAYCAGAVSLLYTKISEESSSNSVKGKIFGAIKRILGNENPSPAAEAGVYGNAWEMKKHVLAGGGSEVISSKMTDAKESDNIFSKLVIKVARIFSPDYGKPEPVRYYNHEDFGDNLNSVKMGDIFGIHYEGSSSSAIAKEAIGENYYTHVGLVVGVSNGGIPIISHYVGGVLYTESLNTLLSGHGGKFSAVEVFRPNHETAWDR